MPKSVRVALAIALVPLAVLAITLLPALAEEPIAPDQQKKEQAPGVELPPELLKDARKATPLQVTDAARPVLEKVRDAYAKLGGLQAGGTWSVEFDIAGEQGKESAEFTSSYAAPNKFRHEVKDDLLFGSTGEQAYAYSRNQYVTADAPKSRVGVADLPRHLGDLLKEKNPSLLLAATSDEQPFLAEGATKVDKGDDVKVGEASFPSLKVTTENGGEVTVLIDPGTSLLRRWSVDLKKSLEARGQDNVKRAVMTIDYVSVKPEAPAGPEAFAWAPPPGAKDAAKMAAATGGEASELEGKPAPAVELEDLEGKTVKLADLKGSVVVLDFWATWCGPCRAGLPVLDKLAAARKDKGLKVYAVNLEEDKADVAAFVKQTNLGLPVLLDPTGDTGRAYGARAIPLTVVIGKDGVVKKVVVGLQEGVVEKAVDEALKG